MARKPRYLFWSEQACYHIFNRGQKEQRGRFTLPNNKRACPPYPSQLKTGYVEKGF